MSAPTTRKKRRSASPGAGDQVLLKTWQRLAEAAGDVLCTVDVLGTITFVSDGVLRLLGCAPENLIGQPFVEWVSPDWKNRIRAFYRRQIRQRTPQTLFELPVIAAAGEKKWIELQSNLLVADDQVLGFECLVRDVTRRRQAESALQSARASSLALMSIPLDSFWSVDRDFRLITLNDTFRQRFYQLYGVRLEVGVSLVEIASPLEIAQWHPLFQRAFAGETFSIEIDFSHQGIPSQAEVFFNPTLNEAGEIVGAAVYSRDITQRKQVELALRDSEERFRSLVENATDVIFTLDLNMNITSLNPAFETITGWSRDEWHGKSFAPLVSGDYLHLARTMFDRALSREEVPPFELLLNVKAGRTLFTEFKIRPLLEKGLVVGISGVARDISQRKQAELERNQYINQLEILQHVDTELSQKLKIDYVLTMALDAAVRLCKADAGAIHLIEDDQVRVAQVIGNYPRSLIGAYVPKDTGIVGRVLRTQQAELVSDVTYDPDYVDHVVETRAQITIPLLSHERLLGTLNVQTRHPERFTRRIFDFLKLLTARVATALDNARLYEMLESQLDELKALYQQVSDLEQLKSEIIRVASHDLRNPLFAIKGYVQMLGWELEKDGDRRADYVKVIKEAADRIDKITSDILTLERVEMTAKGILVETVDLVELARTVYDEFCPRAAEKRIDFQLQAASSQLPVKGDSIFLRESIVNLLSNAIKYTPEGGCVYVHVLTDHQNAVIEVQDNGYGIPQEYQANLFQPFYRPAVKETKTIRGTGLGLHLVKRIVERHKGQLYFKSVYGQGSTFGFRLPLVVSGIHAVAPDNNVAAVS